MAAVSDWTAPESSGSERSPGSASSSGLAGCSSAKLPSSARFRSSRCSRTGWRTTSPRSSAWQRPGSSVHRQAGNAERGQRGQRQALSPECAGRGGDRLTGAAHGHGRGGVAAAIVALCGSREPGQRLGFGRQSRRERRHGMLVPSRNRQPRERACRGGIRLRDRLGRGSPTRELARLEAAQVAARGGGSGDGAGQAGGQSGVRPRRKQLGAAERRGPCQRVARCRGGRRRGSADDRQVARVLRG